MMNKRLFAGIALVIVTAIGAVIWFLSASGGESAEPAVHTQVSASQASPTVTKLDEASAAMLEKALNSSDASEQAKGLYPTLRQGKWSARDLLPDGAKLSVDRTSFKEEDDSIATVRAVVSGSVQAEFTLFLAQDDDKLWRVFATERTR